MKSQTRTRATVSLVIAVSFCTLSPYPATAESVPMANTSVCAGDCNGDGSVTVGELITLINISLGGAPLDACPFADNFGDCCRTNSSDVCITVIGIDCLSRGINNGLVGCERRT